jgi:hypothetical protein
MGQSPRAPSRGSWRQEDVDGSGESVGLSGSLPSHLFKRWASGAGPLGCLVWSLGSLWASGARGSCAGDPWAAAVFPRLTPVLEFADLGADYGADAGSNVAGTIAGMIAGTNVDRPRSGGFQDQACMGLFVLPYGVWVFCLASGGLSGVFWSPFERRVFPPGRPGSPSGPPLGPGRHRPLWGAAGGLRFSLSLTDPGFHLVPLILGRAQKIIRLPSPRCILSPSSSGAFYVS